MKVDFVVGDIIYELVEAVRAKITELLSVKVEEVDVGELKVLAIFRTEKSRMIVGGRVSEGEIRRGTKVRVRRPASPGGGQGGGEDIVGEGRVVQLKMQDKAVEKVEKGQECGVLFEGPVKILVGDILLAYDKRETKIQL